MPMNPMKWTDQQVLDAMDYLKPTDKALNRARQVFSSASAQIEHKSQQRGALSPIQMRRMEFDAVLKIIAAYNGT